ncbi:MAG: hypothetical protein WBB44_06385 [Candidatus Nanopelagicales bacterium]|nr:hypothetical protein [Candidatus Nanopelagicales bacterium]
MKTRIALIAAGLLLLALGAYNLLDQVPLKAFPNLIVWLAAGVVIHDVVIAAGVATIGWAISRAVPARFRAPVQGGLIVAGVVAIMAIPVVIGAGRTPTNPSLLPLDYGRNLVIVLVVIAVLTALFSLLSLRKPSGADERQETSA